ncbi:MAG: response regulator, partial [Bdellovibrionales bacterium]|nr:response regulator [Bdellovibrionales bacterium]
SEQIQRLSKKIEENKERVILVSSKKNKKKLLNNLKIEHIPIIYKPIPNLHSLINNNTNVLKLASSNSIPSALNEFSTSGSSPSLLDPILIVEDNLINQKVTQAILKQHGYNVDFALNGVEGLEKLDQNKYSLVLMDCQMPVLDGFNATRQFRKMELQEQRKRTPIIAMTASAFKETRDKCKQYEMDDFISKPVKGEDLIAIIHKNLNGNDST